MLRVSPDSPVEHPRTPRVGSLWLVAALLSIGGSTLLAQEMLQEIPGCTYVAAPWADGDSFPVRLPDGDEKVIRLYFVDCIETEVSDVTGKRRLREQARYFGVEDFATSHEFGLEATRLVAETLSKPFTIHTSFSKAPGRAANRDTTPSLPPPPERIWVNCSWRKVLPAPSVWKGKARRNPPGRLAGPTRGCRALRRPPWPRTLETLRSGENRRDAP
jgi:hypothetical protein